MTLVERIESFISEDVKKIKRLEKIPDSKWEALRKKLKEINRPLKATRNGRTIANDLKALSDAYAKIQVYDVDAYEEYDELAERTIRKNRANIDAFMSMLEIMSILTGKKRPSKTVFSDDKNFAVDLLRSANRVFNYSNNLSVGALNVANSMYDYAKAHKQALRYSKDNKELWLTYDMLDHLMELVGMSRKPVTV